MPSETSTRQTAAAATDPGVSARMRRQLRHGTRPEMDVRRALHSLGFRYSLTYRPTADIRCIPDLSFPRWRLLVFIDGCFWHGCALHKSTPRRNSAFWRDKLVTNRLRDQRIDTTLRDAGWTVVRVWEHDNPEVIAARVVDELAVQGHPRATRLRRAASGLSSSR